MENMQVFDVKLDKIKYAIQRIFHKEMILDAKIDIFEDYARNLCMRIEKDVLSETLQNETREFKFPINVWNHFKLRHLPNWLVKRFPVKYITISFKFERKAIYPKAKEYLGDSIKEFQFAVIKESIVENTI